MDEYQQQLAIEAITVGAAFLPWSYLISGFVAKSSIAPQYKGYASIFIAGAGFHLVAELSGLNAWYLKHSAANMKVYNRLSKKEKVVESGICFC